jgi:predicted transcriptional regulator
MIVVMNKKSKVFRINTLHLKALERLATKENETVSFLIQQAIREYLQRRAAKQQGGNSHA